MPEENGISGCLPLAPFKSILKNSHAERISEGASKRLRSIVEEYAYKIAKMSVKTAKHAGRYVVLEADVVLSKDLVSDKCNSCCLNKKEETNEDTSKRI